MCVIVPCPAVRLKGCPVRRLSSLVLVAVVGFGSAVIGQVAGVGPASALGSCPDGTIVFQTFWCIDPSTGVETNPLGTSAVAPEQLSVTSTELAASEDGFGGGAVTPAEGLGLTEADAVAGGGTLFTSASIPVVGAIVTGGLIGYQIGTYGAKFSCSLGLGALCIPHEPAVYVPNPDSIASGDPGWQGEPYALTNGAQFSDCGWEAPSAGPAYGDTHSAFIDVYCTASGFHPAASTTNYSAEMDGYCEDGTEFNVNGVGWSTDAAGNNLNYINSNPGFSYFVNGSFCGSNGGFDHIAVMAGGDGTPLHQQGNWWPVGNPSRPAAGAGGNPDRKWETQNTCVDASGTSSTVHADGQTFTETDASLPAFPDAPDCPPGTTLAGTKVVETTPNLPNKTVWQQTVPTAITTARNTYPACLNATCHLGLYKADPSGSLKSCFKDSGLCEGWFSDPNKASLYTCTYGPSNTSSDSPVALSECNVYAPTFDVKQQAAGVPYGDPLTGTPVEPSPDPNPSPTPDPSIGSCFPSGWGAFNPFEWVLKPVECALEWAFIPDQATMNSLADTMNATEQNTGVGQWYSAISGLLGSLETNGTGCAGPEVTFPGTGTVIHPVDACDEPMATVAHIAYAFTSLVIVVGGAFAGFKAFAAAFGYSVTFGPDKGMDADGFGGGALRE